MRPACQTGRSGVAAGPFRRPASASLLQRNDVGHVSAGSYDVHHLFRRHRSGQEVALHLVAAQRPQRVQLLDNLNALRNDRFIT
jgi:hypothetical protein